MMHQEMLKIQNKKKVNSKKSMISSQLSFNPKGQGGNKDQSQQDGSISKRKNSLKQLQPLDKTKKANIFTASKYLELENRLAFASLQIV